MPTLNDLPAELLLEILSHTGLRTTALWRFLTISKAIYKKIALLAYRKELRLLYSKIDWGKNQPSAIYIRRIRAFLRTIVHRHDLAEMVNHLALASGWRSNREELYERTKTGRYIDDEELFLDAATRIGFAPDSDSGNYQGPTDGRKAANMRAWRALTWAIQSSLMTGELILLLAHLPNLESLWIDAGTGDFRLPWSRLLTSSTNSLSKLKHLKVFGHPGVTIQGSDLSFLLGLPSLRTLEICDATCFDALLPSGPKLLGIKELTMQNSSVGGETLRTWATRFRGLETFTLVVSRYSNFYRDLSTHDIRQFITAQQSTLQSLTIAHPLLLKDPRFHWPLQPLSHLTHLKDLTISLRVLTGTSRRVDQSFDLQDYLPASIQRLHITRPFPSTFESVMKGFAVWLERNRNTFPDFKTVLIDGHRGLPELEKLGIEVVPSESR